MLTLQRQEEIMNILRQKKTVTVNELSETLFASGSTIRRDLAELENAGLIRRSHGGAVLFESSGDEASARVREQENRRQKKVIGELAAGLLQKRKLPLSRFQFDRRSNDSPLFQLFRLDRHHQWSAQCAAIGRKSRPSGDYRVWDGASEFRLAVRRRYAELLVRTESGVLLYLLWGFERERHY